MTPAADAFASRFGAPADQVATGTGINRWALLIQWAVETNLGSAVFGNNPGNIECGPGIFCRFATLDEFAASAISVWHQTAFINNKYPNGFEPFRSRAVGLDVESQLLTIGESPWDAGNYGLAACGYAGCSLVRMWETEFGEIADMTPQESAELHAIYEQFVSPTYLTMDARITAILTAIKNLQASSLTTAQAQQLAHIETMLTTGLTIAGAAKGT